MSRYPGGIITKSPATPTGPSPTGAAPGVWRLNDVAYWMKQGLWPDANADAYWPYNSLLLSTTSTNNAQNNTFLDSSTNNFTITRNGNTTQGSFSPYGSLWSNYFDGTGDYLTATSNAAFAFGTGDFTIEAWVYVANTSSQMIFVDLRGASSTTTAPLIYMTSSGVVNYYTNGSVQITGTGITANTWNHLAVARSGTSTKLFINGTQAGSTYSDSNNYVQSSVYIARASDTAGSYVNGYMSNVRLVKGTALYTANFTVPTAPLTAITNTSLLTCQSNRFIDNSTNNFTITRNGDVKVTPFSPFSPSTAYSIGTNGGSAYFDGSGDYLSLPSNAAFGFGTGDFTVECWVNPSSQGGHGSGNNDCIIDFRPGTGGGAYGTLYIVNSGAGVNWYADGANRITGSAISNSAWTHIVVSRVSGSTRLFINGAQSGSTYSDSINYGTTNPWIGQFDDGTGSGYFNGYMSGLRIVKGSGVTSVTVPTTPPTAITNTVLLLNATNAGIYDATAINNMETVGTVQASTVQSKFGGSSAYFNNDTAARIKPPASQNFAFGTGNFTVEAWVYVTNLTTENFVFDTRSSVSTAGMGFSLEPNTGKLRYSGNANNVLTSTSVSANTWTHVAWVRNGSTLTGYINGVSGGTASNSDNLTQTNGEIGNVPFAAVATNMYIDDLRVTNGVARYTANFTPPTAAFPVY